MKRISILLILISSLGCNDLNKKSNSTQLGIDIGSSDKRINLSDIASNINLTSLEIPDSVFFGNITSVKTSEGEIFLLDKMQTQTITVFDDSGRFVKQLNARGEGPGKYKAIHDFVIDRYNNELVIYDRNISKLFFYNLSNLDFLKSLSTSKAFISFEVIDAKHFFTISDTYNSKNELIGPEIIERSTLKAVYNPFESFPTMSVKASESIMINKIDGKVYYSKPHSSTDLFLISSNNFSKILSVNFKSNQVPSDLWDKNVGEFITELSRNEHRTAAHAFLIEENLISFWYMKGSFRTRIFNIFDRKINKLYSYNQIRMDWYETPLTPANSTYKNGYIHLLSPSNLTDQVFQNEYIDLNFSNQQIQELVKSENPILLTYDIKL